MYLVQSWVNGEGCDSWSFENRSVAEGVFKAKVKARARDMWKENRQATVKLDDSEVWAYSLCEEDDYGNQSEDLEYESLSWKKAKERLGD